MFYHYLLDKLKLRMIFYLILFFQTGLICKSPCYETIAVTSFMFESAIVLMGQRFEEISLNLYENHILNFKRIDELDLLSQSV